MNEIRQNFIEILRLSNKEWGMNKLEKKENFKNLFDLIPIEDFKKKEGIASLMVNDDDYKTKLICENLTFQSPVKFDVCIELPVVELYIDNLNYTLLTTKNIYFANIGYESVVNYIELKSIDHELLNNQFEKGRKNESHIFEIIITTLNNKRFSLLVEYLVPARGIIRLLNHLI